MLYHRRLSTQRLLYGHFSWWYTQRYSAPFLFSHQHLHGCHFPQLHLPPHLLSPYRRMALTPRNNASKKKTTMVTTQPWVNTDRRRKTTLPQRLVKRGGGDSVEALKVLNKKLVKKLKYHAKLEAEVAYPCIANGKKILASQVKMSKETTSKETPTLIAPWAGTLFGFPPIFLLSSLDFGLTSQSQ